MKEELTFMEAYKVMYYFLREYYYQMGKPESLGNLLSEIGLLDDGKPADPAMWDDWKKAIKQVVETNDM